MSTAALALDRMTFDAFLAFEAEAEGKHEFVGGQVYAMTGGTDRHNIVTLNLAAELRAHLRGRPCRPFMADMALHVALDDDTEHYYPDVMVCCDSVDNARRLHREQPCLIAEVASPSTERIDRREKFSAYGTIQGLREYVLLQSDVPKIEIFRRELAWKPQVFYVDDHVTLHSIDLTIPMRTLYEGVDYLK